MEHPFDQVIAALQAHGLKISRRSADRVQAQCPGHRDIRPSLTVTRTDKGVLLHCHAGCPKGAPARALGFEPRDLFVSGTRPTKQRGMIVATYDYSARDGQPVQKVRFEPKQFAWRRPDPAARAGWHWGLNRPLADLQLYRSPELGGARLVFVVEGEKAVEALMQIDLVATCGPGGASTWQSSWTANLLEAVAGEATIAILPDNDRPGERHAEQVAANIYRKLGEKAVAVKVVTLPALAAGADVVDWIEAGHDRDGLIELVFSTPVWMPGAIERRRAEQRRDKTRERVARWRTNRRALTGNAAACNAVNDQEVVMRNAVTREKTRERVRRHRAQRRGLPAVTAAPAPCNAEGVTRNAVTPVNSIFTLQESRSLSEIHSVTRESVTEKSVTRGPVTVPALGCCALGTCTDPDCDLCTRVARLPQPGRQDQAATFRHAEGLT